MMDLWQRVKDKEKPFEQIARMFKVSGIVAARRALDLGLITKEVFLDFYQERRKRNVVRKSDGGDFYRTQNMRIGKRFATNVILAVMAGKLLYQEAYRLTGLRGKAFEKYAERLGFVGI
jgi:Zn-dependent peptidase ImmA (M78 family)